MPIEPFDKQRSLGLHITLDYWGCQFEVLNDLGSLEKVFLEAVRLSKATIIKSIFHQFSPHGVTGVVAIAESHVSIHTWPEHGFAAVDIFTCSETMDIEVFRSHIETFLKPNRVVDTCLIRGHQKEL